MLNFTRIKSFIHIYVLHECPINTAAKIGTFYYVSPPPFFLVCQQFGHFQVFMRRPADFQWNQFMNNQGQPMFVPCESLKYSCIKRVIKCCAISCYFAFFILYLSTMLPLVALIISLCSEWLNMSDELFAILSWIVDH